MTHLAKYFYACFLDALPRGLSFLYTNPQVFCIQCKITFVVAIYTSIFSCILKLPEKVPKDRVGYLKGFSPRLTIPRFNHAFSVCSTLLSKHHLSRTTLIKHIAQTRKALVFVSKSINKLSSPKRHVFIRFFLCFNVLLLFFSYNQFLFILYLFKL